MPRVTADELRNLESWSQVIFADWAAYLRGLRHHEAYWAQRQAQGILDRASKGWREWPPDDRP